MFRPDRLPIGAPLHAVPSTVRRPRAALLVALLLASVAGLGANAMTADASGYSFCTGFYSAGDHCDGSYVTLLGTDAYDDFGSNRVCAGAVYGGSFYGSYACGNGYAGQCYSAVAAQPLAPRAHNGESYAQQMHGVAYQGFCP